MYKSNEVLKIISDFCFVQQECDPNVTTNIALDDRMSFEEFKEIYNLKDLDSFVSEFGGLLNINSEDILMIKKSLRSVQDISLTRLAEELSKFSVKRDITISDVYQALSRRYGERVDEDTTLTALFKVDGSMICEVLSLYKPGIISQINNVRNKKASYLQVISAFIVIVVLLVVNVCFGYYKLITIGLTLIGLILFISIQKLYPAEIRINGFSTIGDLINSEK